MSEANYKYHYTRKKISPSSILLSTFVLCDYILLC